VAFFGGTRMGYYSISSTTYLAPHIEGLDFREPWGSANNPVITSDPVIFVFLPEQLDNLDLVQQDMPGGQLISEYDQQGGLLYLVYIVDHSEAP